MTEFSFTIPGPPRPWKRATNKRDRQGNIIGRATDEGMRVAKAHVRACARTAALMHRVRKPLDVPLEVTVQCYRRRLSTATPDADNYGKLVLDSGNKILWRDDSIVVRLICEKHDTREVGGEEQTVVTVRPFVRKAA